MRLNVNRLLVRKGTIIEISWDTSGMTMPEMVLTLSGKDNVIAVETAGSKKIRVGGSSFKNSISLRAYDSAGKLRTIKRSLYIWGSMKPEGQYDSYTRITPLKRYSEFVKNYWRRYPIEKRRLYIILVLLMVSILVSGEAGRIITIATMGYVLYLMFKR